MLHMDSSSNILEHTAGRSDQAMPYVPITSPPHQLYFKSHRLGKRERGGERGREREREGEREGEGERGRDM